LTGNLHFLGIDVRTLRANRTISEEDLAQIQAMVDQRKAARDKKDWAESDRLRDALAQRGVVVMDNKNGASSWALTP